MWRHTKTLCRNTILPAHILWGAPNLFLVFREKILESLGIVHLLIFQQSLWTCIWCWNGDEKYRKLDKNYNPILRKSTSWMLYGLFWSHLCQGKVAEPRTQRRKKRMTGGMKLFLYNNWIRLGLTGWRTDKTGVLWKRYKRSLMSFQERKNWEIISIKFSIIKFTWYGDAQL